jgi:hypothetical protein
MITIKRYHGNNFYLMPTLLQQRFGFGYKYRQVRRSEIAWVFRKPLNPGGIQVGLLSGQYHGKRWSPQAWTMRVYQDGSMSIGCQGFPPKETVQIRRWALAKRKKRKS